MDPQTIASTFVYIGIAALAASLVFLTINRRLPARLAAVVGVLFVCFGSMYPPGQRLNKGIDLNGGTSLTYEIDLTGADNYEQTIQQTIAVLRQRVDPDGLRNLIWRVEGGNRIEIQMPLAGANVIERRDAYRAALAELDRSSVSRAEVLAALRSEPEQRDGALANLVRGVQSRADLLTRASILQDRRDDARQRYEAETDPERRIDLAGEVASIERELDGAIDAVVATNLPTAELRAILGASRRPRFDTETGEPIPGSSPRERLLEQFREAHPSRVEQIDALAEAYDAYQAVKGPLDDPEDLKRLLRGAGVLDFRIAVARTETTNVEDLRRRLRERGPQGIGSDSPMRWYVIDDPAEFFNTTGEAVASFLTEVDNARSESERLALIDRQFGSFIGEVFQGRPYVLLWNTTERSLVGGSREGQPEWKLTNASPTQDDLGFAAVRFDLDTIGANLFGTLTRNNVGRAMAIVLDDRVYSAPVINGPITSSGRITGGRSGFGPDELQYLIRTLGAGSLKARVSEEPISERNVSPALGQDNINAGFEASKDAMIAVVIFMMAYYFFAGAVADLALLANLVIILGVLSMVQAAFTLPGIAGIVLTIGMSVDANVLIFERIREELNRGATMPTALRLGYEKALSSIVDGNLTNLIVCFVLYYTATADVKGFAVTLGIGIVATLFSALFMTRAIFDLYYRAFGENRRMLMLPSAVPFVERLLSPSVRWTAKRSLFFVISGSLVAGSIVLCVTRGVDMLDIEFRAGTEVEFSLKEGELLGLQEARDRINATALGADGMATQLVATGEVDSEFRASQFSVLTTEADPDIVTEQVLEAFGDLIDIPPQITFAGGDAASLADAPVYPVSERSLAASLNRPGLDGEAPAEYLGGVAIVLEGIDPPQTVEQITDRIVEMRLQPDFENMPYRRPLVIALAVDADGNATQAVVLVADDSASFLENPEAWRDNLASGEWELTREALGRQTSFSKVSNFDASVARTMQYDAIAALALSILAIVAYIWFRFGSLRYGLTAVVALVHDVVISLGAIALSGYLYDTVFGTVLMLDGFKINMAMIAALLTILGYSLNDTIVVFDRIRENRGKLAVASPAVINDSINQTISRSVLTSGTTFLAVAILYTFGGSGVHGFAFAMVIGIVVGTYSSIAVASPLLLIGTKYARAGGGGAGPA